MRGKFLYLCLLLFTAYVEIMYDHSHAILFLGFELLLLLFMLLLALYLKFHVRMEVRVRKYSVNKGKPLEAEVMISNRGWLPASRIQGGLALKNAWDRVEGEEPILCEADGRRRIAKVYRFPVKYCGKYALFMEKAGVCDYLGMFRFKIGKGMQSRVQVLPDFYEIPVEVGEYTRNFPVDGEEYDPHRSGDDPSEIFQIREYRPGDGMQRIHWKMSAKAGEWMTKEYGLPVGCCVLFLLDLHQEKRKEIEASRLDQILETAVSISYSLMMAECLHYAAWYEERTNEIHRCCIKGEEDVYRLQEEILEAFPYEDVHDLEEGYRSRYPEGRYATVLRLDQSLLLWRNGEIYADLADGTSEDLGSRLILKV